MQYHSQDTKSELIQYFTTLLFWSLKKNYVSFIDVKNSQIEVEGKKKTVVLSSFWNFYCKTEIKWFREGKFVLKARDH